MASIIDTINNGENFYVDINEFEKHQLDKNGEPTATHVYFKLYTNLTDTLPFMSLTNTLQEALYLRLLILRARTGKAIGLLKGSLTYHLYKRSGISEKAINDALEKLEEVQLVTISKTPIVKDSIGESRVKGKRKVKEELLENETTTTTTEPSGSGSSEIEKLNTLTRFDYDKGNFEGFKDIQIKGKTFREHIENDYPKLNFNDEIKKAANWLMARDKDRGDRSYIGGYSFLINWFNQASKAVKDQK